MLTGRWDFAPFPHMQIRIDTKHQKKIRIKAALAGHSVKKEGNKLIGIALKSEKKV